MFSGGLDYKFHSCLTHSFEVFEQIIKVGKQFSRYSTIVSTSTRKMSLNVQMELMSNAKKKKKIKVLKRNVIDIGDDSSMWQN